MSTQVILFLAAHPRGTSELRLQDECAAIQRELTMSRNRADFHFESRWAVGIDDLRRHLVDFNPTVIHFSGHGGGPSGLVLQGESGEQQFVQGGALTKLIRAAAPGVRLVVLNACYTVVQAEALCTAVDCVVGMDGAIGDEAARRFAVAFYGSLVSGRSVGNARDIAVAVLDSYQLPDERLPHCLVRAGVDPHKVILDPR